VGGGLSRTLISNLYGGVKTEVDYDFIVNTLNSQLILPDGWKVTTNKYGNPKLIKEKQTIDIMPLDTIHSIKRRKLTPTINHFLTGTPFTIQSLAYNIKSEELVGPIGIKAILTKTVGINNLKQAMYNTKLKGTTVKSVFRPVLSEPEASDDRW